MHIYVRTADVVNRGLWRIFPAINCDRTTDIPSDHPGPIGVPITYMDKHDPERFEIIDLIRPKIGNRNLYRRIIIRHLHPELPEIIDLAEWLERSGVRLEIKISEVQ